MGLCNSTPPPLTGPLREENRRWLPARLYKLLADVSRQRAKLHKHLGKRLSRPLIDIIRSYGDPIPADDLDAFIYLYDHCQDSVAATRVDFPKLATYLLQPLVGRRGYGRRLRALLNRIAPSELPTTIPYYVMCRRDPGRPPRDGHIEERARRLRQYYLHDRMGHSAMVQGHPRAECTLFWLHGRTGLLCNLCGADGLRVHNWTDAEPEFDHDGRSWTVYHFRAQCQHCGRVWTDRIVT